MVKSRVATKEKSTAVMLELDGQTVEALDGIAELAGVTRSEVISVMLSTKVYNDKKYQEDRLEKGKCKTRTGAALKEIERGIADKKLVLR